MRNKVLVLFIAVVMGLAFASHAVMAQDTPAVKKESGCAMKADSACCQKMICPVSGEAANKEFFSEYKGQKVFFCCKKAKEAFDKDPAKYEAKIHKCTGDCKKEGEESCCKEGQKKCEKADSCCKAVEKKCAADEACCKSEAKMSDKAGACCREAMVCPVTGKPGNKEFFSEYKGQKVFFCCKKAKEAFDKDPAKYEAKIHKCTGECRKAEKKTEKPEKK